MLRCLATLLRRQARPGFRTEHGFDCIHQPVQDQIWNGADAALRSHFAG
jgi:hypothetical protein